MSSSASGDVAVQTPSRVHDPTPYSTAAPPVEFSTGGLLCGGEYAWLLSPGGFLRVFQSSDGECIAQLSLSPGKGRRVTLSCSCELNPGTLSTPRNNPLLALALTVDGVRPKAAIAVLDPLASRIERVAEVPWAVTSLCGVSGPAIQSAVGLFSPALLREFSGVLAVGCAGGHALLVDLALGVYSVGQGCVQRPLKLVFADVSQRGASVVSSARNDGEQLACVDLLASNHKKGQFHYTSTNQATTRSFPTDSLAITSLHFVPQILCLLIGYSIGSFQFYDVRKMAVVHGSPPPKTPVPVTHFTFQEPENDPKSNVYIWVARGSPEHANLDVEAKLTLYQVMFENKVCGERGTIYQDFSRCGPGFLYPLTPTPSRPHPNRSLSSSLLLCRTVELTRASGREPDDESHDPAFHGPDLTVAMFVWRCGDSAHRDYIIGVFDLNQYYHNQVPKMLHWRTSGKHSGVLGCSYFAFYSLRQMTGKNTILDVAVMDVAPFLSSLPPIPESHLWPTSLSFNVRAITSREILDCSCPGLQRMALQELTGGDVAMFSCPQRVFSLCERADLLGSPGWDLDHIDVEAQRKALLSVALDHNMGRLLRDIAFTWSSGGGDTSFSVFLEWLRDKMEDMRNQQDHICEAVLGGVGDSTDKSACILDSLGLKFSLLSSLLASLLSPLTPPHTSQLSLSTEFPSDSAHFNELSAFYVTAASSHLVIQVLTWCLRNSLLPASGSGGFLYATAALDKLYNRIRREMGRLCVDHLSEDILINDYHYPPTSLEAQLVTFTSTHTLAQHCLMMYFIIDLCTLGGETSFNQKELSMSYSQEFHLPEYLVSLVRVFWSLDHSQYQVAITHLREEGVGDREWFPWQQTALGSHLAKSTDSQSLALLLASTNALVKDAKLLLKVLVERQSLWEALKLIRECDDESIDEIFMDFLDLCHEHKCLGKLVNMPMTESEDALFCAYLDECPSFQAQELLVMHYAAHNRYGDAVIQQSKIRPLAMVDPVPGAKERSLFRDGLLEAYRSTAPSVLSQLWKSAESTQHHPPPLSPSRPSAAPRTRVKNPPLSAVLAKKEAAASTVTSADFIFQEMQKIRDAAETEPVSSPFTQKDSICPSTPFFSHPPSVRKAMLSRQKLSSTVIAATPGGAGVEGSEFSSLCISTPFQPSHSSSMVSGLTSLRTHMEGFKQRMFQMSQTANIDPSILATPTAPVRQSVSVLSPRPLPASILKVKNGRKEEGEIGEDGEGVRAEPRRIRFAEEGTILESPTSSVTSAQPITQSSQPKSRPPLTSAQAVAAATPLPSSDDSDMFYSFTDSPHPSTPPPPPPPPPQPKPPMAASPSPPPLPPPSHFSPSPPLLQGTPSQSPLPKTQLFIGADDDEDDDDKQQQQQSMDTTSANTEPHSTAVVTATVVTTTASSSPQQKVRLPLLSREGIRFRPRATPTATPTSRVVVGGTFAPRHPSPLAHSISLREPKINFPGGPHRSSPFSRDSDRGANKTREKSSSSMDVFSATMVPVLTQEEQEEKEDKKGGASSSFTKVSTVGTSSHKYSFSRGKIISTPPPLPPPVSELREVTPRGNQSGYVFSPPLTRSAARRAAGGGGGGGRMTREDEEGGGESSASTAVEKERQKIKKTTSTRGRRSLAGVRHAVELVTPPSQHTTPTTSGRTGQRSKKKHSMKTRSSRSTRLVQDKKPC